MNKFIYENKDILCWWYQGHVSPSFKKGISNEENVLKGLRHCTQRVEAFYSRGLVMVFKGLRNCTQRIEAFTQGDCLGTQMVEALSSKC